MVKVKWFIWVMTNSQVLAHFIRPERPTQYISATDLEALSSQTNSAQSRSRTLVPWPASAPLVKGNEGSENEIGLYFLRVNNFVMLAQLLTVLTKGKRPYTSKAQCEPWNAQHYSRPCFRLKSNSFFLAAQSQLHVRASRTVPAGHLGSRGHLQRQSLGSLIFVFILQGLELQTHLQRLSSNCKRLEQIFWFSLGWQTHWHFSGFHWNLIGQECWIGLHSHRQFSLE